MLTPVLLHAAQPSADLAGAVGISRGFEVRAHPTPFDRSNDREDFLRPSTTAPTEPRPEHRDKSLEVLEALNLPPHGGLPIRSDRWEVDGPGTEDRVEPRHDVEVSHHELSGRMGDVTLRTLDRETSFSLEQPCAPGEIGTRRRIHESSVAVASDMNGGTP